MRELRGFNPDDPENTCTPKLLGYSVFAVKIQAFAANGSADCANFAFDIK